MTRINTNISALTANQNLANSNNALQTTLTRLSTGLQINSAADNPAGMIAATDLGSNIAASNQAISNSQIAGQMLSTADSALSQISSLLTTINGLVTESANTSSQSSSQIAANQLQIDSSLSAINTIANTTTFQGQNLLDGSLAFKTTGTSANYSAAIQNLQVNQVGTTPTASSPVGVDIHVKSVGTQASLTGTVSTGGTAASTTITFGDTSTLSITAPNPGTAGNSIKVNFNETATQAAGTASASFNATTNVLTINVNNTAAGTTSASTIAAAINKDTDFTAGSTNGGGGTGVGYVEGTDTNTTLAANETLAGGAGGTAGLAASLALQVGGNAGSTLLTFNQGTTIAQLVTAINQATASTGVTAAASGNTLTFTSSTYGSAANVSVQVVNEGTGGTFGSSLSANSASGTDIVATVNGVAATGQGNTVSLNTPELGISASLNPSIGSNVDVTFNITGGGALFQLGPVVTSAQQVNLGIQGVTTASLGGTVGQLYEIGSGQDASLTNNPTKAGQIVQAALNDITSLRGELGAFQTSTIDTNISTLTSAVTNLTAAQSSIQDTDFAAASANLSREQILVQSGTTVAGIASSTPANVLSLLQKAAQV